MEPLVGPQNFRLIKFTFPHVKPLAERQGLAIVGVHQTEGPRACALEELASGFLLKHVLEPLGHFFRGQGATAIGVNCIELVINLVFRPIENAVIAPVYILNVIDTFIVFLCGLCLSLCFCADCRRAGAKQRSSQ